MLNIKKQGIYDTIIIIDGDGYKRSLEMAQGSSWQ